MVKEKILLIIVSILFIFAFALIMIEHAPYTDKSYSDTEISQNDTRVAKAIEKEYHENGDYTSMTLQTEDKRLWTVNNTVCPLQSECEIEFDTKNTISVEDDEIIAVHCRIY